MFGRARGSGLVIALAIWPVTADAADCPQARAIYTDRDGAYELSFHPAQSEAESATHRFSLTVVKTKLVLDGYVMGSEPVDRSSGMIFHDCPDGDATGEDIRACTIWKGFIYGSGEGHIGLLPAEGEKAADAILLSGLGPAIRASSIWGAGRAETVPWDVLTLKGCSS